MQIGNAQWTASLLSDTTTSEANMDWNREALLHSLTVSHNCPEACVHPNLYSVPAHVQDM